MLTSRGRFLLAQKEPDAARVAWESAIRIFARMGATPFLKQTETELDRLLNVRHTWAHALSAREQDVAELVGAGMTNNEIAAALHVSVKTIEYHLSNVYAKLAITGRRELRLAVRGEG